MREEDGIIYTNMIKLYEDDATDLGTAQIKSRGSSKALCHWPHVIDVDLKSIWVGYDSSGVSRIGTENRDKPVVS
jgi:hypothetical protein